MDKWDQRLDAYGDRVYQRPFWTITKTLIVGVAVIAVVGVVGSYLSMVGTVATAPAKIISRTMDPANIIHNYEWFYDVNAQYQARTAQIASYAGEVGAATDTGERARLRTEVGAMQQSCRDLATQYNANSQKMNREIFKGWSLPGELEIATCGAKVGG